MTEQPGQTGAETKTAAQPTSFWIQLYGRLLLRVEYAIVLIFFTAMVLGATLHLFDAFEDASAAQLVVFATAFYLCLFGAVIATRRSHHIAVDAITPRLAPKIRRRVEGALLVVSGGVVVYLTALASTYIFGEAVQADATFLSGDERWFWRRRLWYAPTVSGFGLMALHFLVIGGIKLSGRDPAALGVTGESKPQETTTPAEGLT